MVTWSIFIRKFAPSITFQNPVLTIPTVWFSSIFSIWLMIPGYLLLLIGGGANMVGAMVWTIVSDVTRVDERPNVFYQLIALTLIINALINPITAWLMSYSPWLPTFLGVGFLYLSCFCVLLMPETRLVGLALQQVSNSPSDEANTGERDDSNVKDNGVLPPLWRKFCKSLTELWEFIIVDKKIMVLCFAEAASMPITTAMVLFALQYVAARFQWEWSRATFMFTITKMTSVVLLLVILPLSTHLILKRFNIVRLKLDMYFARTSAILFTAALLGMGLANTEWELICALVVYGLSQGYSAQVRLLITAMVEPHMVATVNTTLSTLESVMLVITIPVVGWLLGKGLEIGGFWMGLPYMALAAMGGLTSLTLCLLRV